MIKIFVCFGFAAETFPVTSVTSKAVSADNIFLFIIILSFVVS
ncbi:MAG: hypothetical protein P8P49_01605 [Opitutales bacterium]|nr:hypothetical protein [Opitutales bacterium]MDG1324432.1 hypothetical protein [Opitutales bacterium]